MKLVIHVVGFDVGAAAARQLQCIAKATGGKYFSASNADSLLEAMQTVSDEVTQKVEEAKVTGVQAATGLGQAEDRNAQGFRNQSGLPADHSGQRRQDRERNREPQGKFGHPLLSGKYEVACGFATPNYGDPTLTEIGEVTIVKGETRELQLGSISFNIPKNLIDNDWKNRINVSEVILADAGTNEPLVTVRATTMGTTTTNPSRCWQESTTSCSATQPIRNHQPSSQETCRSHR